MRALLLLVAAAAAPSLAQNPVVQVTNATRPAAGDFLIGDRYRIVITAAPGRPVSVRTTVKGRTNWSPVIGWTDSNGQWTTTGQLDKTDFGGWSATWTVGGRQASPVIHLSVSPPCLKEGPAFQGGSGPNMFLTCDTAEGRQTFVTRSDHDPFRTPDGRVIPGDPQSDMTAEQYHAEILEYFIGSREKEMQPGPLGDEAADLILKLIGVNALNDDEIGNVIAILRAAFEKPESIPQAAKVPSRTLVLLRNLAELTDQERLKQQIAETIAYVQSR